MGRFISISLVAVLISNTVVLAQKYMPLPVRMFDQETALVATPFIQNDLPKTTKAEQAANVTIHIYNYTNSNYLTLEVLGASEAMTFQLINSQGQEMYSGTIRGTQLIEKESWPDGTYYLLCGSKRETLYVSK
jgi:hypothetical protein